MMIKITIPFFFCFFIFLGYSPLGAYANSKIHRVHKLLREGTELAAKGQYPQALSKFHQAEKRMPRYGITLYLLGKCYNSIKKYQKGWNTCG